MQLRYAVWCVESLGAGREAVGVFVVWGKSWWVFGVTGDILRVVGCLDGVLVIGELVFFRRDLVVCLHIYM